ncbi:MAG: hypothetical protein RJA70_3688, partial [Pseudomonadota bacterium]
MSDGGPRFERSQLRQCSTPAAIERVWSRLEVETEPRRTSLGRVSVAWGGALSVMTFVLGLWLGGASFGGSQVGSPGERTDVFAEPTPSAAAADALGRPAGERHRATGAGEGARERGSVTRRRVPPSLLGTPEESPVGALPAASSVRLRQLGPEFTDGVPASAAPEPPRWQKFANAGEYEAALVEIGQAGGFEAVLGWSDAEQLMLLADVARATGQRQRALAALRRILLDFRDGHTAPLAAYSLGNMLEKAGESQAAAEAFAAYRALSPRGDFAEDALVRELRSAVVRGQRERALQLLAQYDSAFSEVRPSDEVERLRARLQV